MHPASCPPAADSLCFSKLPGSKKLARLRRTQTVFDPLSADFPMLGGEPMGKLLTTNTDNLACIAIHATQRTKQINLRNTKNNVSLLN